MSKFRVGDVCEIILVGGGFERFVGTECTILTNPITGYGVHNGTVAARHQIQCALDGDKWFIEPCQLRLKRPPSWDRWIYDTSGLPREVDSEQRERA